MREEGTKQSPLIKRLQRTETVQEEHARVSCMIREASARAPPSVVPHLQELSSQLAWVVIAVKKAVPIYVRTYKQAFDFVSKLPADLLRSLYGFCLCFFGGSYVASLACISAFKLCGWETTKQCIVELREEYRLVEQRSIEDDAVNANSDDITDVDKMSSLVQRKINIALTTANPDKIKRALSGLYTASLAVLATMKIKFARTVALGMSVATTLRVAAGHYLVPILVHLLPPEHHRWIETLIDLACKFTSVTIAWFLQRTISAVHR